MRRADFSLPLGQAGAPAVGRGRSLLRRVSTMLWGVPLVAACLWLGGWPLAIATFVLAVLGLLEFWALGGPFGVRGPLRPEAVAGAAALLIGGTVGPRAFGIGMGVAVLLVLVGAVVRASARARDELGVELAAAIWSLLGLLYVPWLLGHFLLLRGLGPAAHGLVRALAAVGIVWVSDVAAFVAGGAIGRHRLAEGISPGKSVEGACAGVVAAAAIAGGMARPMGIPVVAAVGVGAILALAGLVGDLWESLLKRGAGVKDSGAGLPGHGGILDRIDSLLLAAPLAYWLLARLPWSLIRPHP